MKTEYDVGEIMYLPYRIKGIQIGQDKKIMYVLEALFPFKTEFTQQENIIGYGIRNDDIDWGKRK